ncbi:MAG: hypothetical protein JXR58_02295 [Bacteroidales bacterium]|nr:hypothetical protein [Bacteroidales bacterium]
MTENTEDFSLGRFFGPTKRGLSLVCAIMAIAAFLMAVYIVSFLFLVLIIFLLFTKKGIEINLSKREYQLYLSLFSWRTYGKAKSVDEYSYVSVLKSNLIHTAYSRTNRSAVTGVEKTFNIVLLGKKQIMKLVIGKFENKEEAIERANQLSEVLKIPYVAYCPQIAKHSD